MQKVSKTFQYLSVVLAAIWLGANLSRIMLTFYLFEGNHFDLKPFITDAFLQAIFYIINPLLVLTSITYPLFFICLILFVLSSRIKLKQNGWLFIMLILVVTLAPFEFYLINLDYKILTTVFGSTYDPRFILELTIKRFKILGSFPLIHLFSFLALIYLSIFQPFKKNEN
ncbi:MAG: hypothetical protein M0P61_11610 [Ignavibacteriaceae bacterium]|jgi:hypothetical protein|nr:hypothetical protein [Ignavibacteriaceae bacterium]